MEGRPGCREESSSSRYHHSSRTSSVCTPLRGLASHHRQQYHHHQHSHSHHHLTNQELTNKRLCLETYSNNTPTPCRATNNR